MASALRRMRSEMSSNNIYNIKNDCAREGSGKNRAADLWMSYNFADGTVICVREMSADELRSEIRKHGAVMRVSRW